MKRIAGGGLQILRSRSDASNGGIRVSIPIKPAAAACSRGIMTTIADEGCSRPIRAGSDELRIRTRQLTATGITYACDSGAVAAGYRMAAGTHKRLGRITAPGDRHGDSGETDALPREALRRDRRSPARGADVLSLRERRPPDVRARASECASGWTSAVAEGTGPRQHRAVRIEATGSGGLDGESASRIMCIARRVIYPTTCNLP
jgi:hypothetical protein